MNVRPFIAAATLAVVSCSPTPPGPQPNTTYFWAVTGSTVAFNDFCTDDMTFRGLNPPFAAGANVFFIYKGSADGRTATMMDCKMLDPNTCTPHIPALPDGGTILPDGGMNPPIVLTVAGSELSYQTESKQPIGTTMCNQQDDIVWLITDHVQTLDVQITDTISLVDSDTDCARIEMDIESRSANHKGYQGCAITRTLTGTAQ
jgi:hypothetical protein